jgi:7-keto-8-aminopelargonate synthetase-like enzyme
MNHEDAATRRGRQITERLKTWETVIVTSSGTEAAVVFGAIGMGIGAAIDALSRREQVVFVRAAEAPVKATIRLFAMPHSAGLRVTIGF